MFRLVTIPLLPALLCLSGFGCGKKDSGGGSGDSASGSGQMPAGWVKVSIPEGQCEVWMPSQPPREVQDNEGGLKNYMYLLMKDKYVHMASVTSVPTAAQLKVLKSRGDAAYHVKASRDRVMEASPGTKLVSDKEIQFEGQPGREFIMSDPDGSWSRYRTYCIANQVYQLAVGTPTQAELTSKESEAFFNSFKVLGGSPKGK